MTRATMLIIMMMMMIILMITMMMMITMNLSMTSGNVIVNI